MKLLSITLSKTGIWCRLRVVLGKEINNLSIIHRIIHPKMDK